MANSLVAPGVSVTVVDESFYIPASASTVPLIFIATADEKLQMDGRTPAAGTYESNTVRTVTSLQQSLQLYGVPRFLEDYNGKPMHGDARNEQGLAALNNYLGVGSMAYVLRANVNLNDDVEDIAANWATKLNTASYQLQNYVNAFLDEYNTINGYFQYDEGFKTTITQTELMYLADKATADVFALNTFRKAKPGFYEDLSDSPTDTAGYQDVNFGGSITDELGSTGLFHGTLTAKIDVNGVARMISIDAANATDFQSLVTEINNDLGGVAYASIVNGNIRITSNSVGSNSKVLITDTDLFVNVTGFASFLLPINGVLHEDAMPVYEDGFNQPSTGTFIGFAGMAAAAAVQDWTATEAADLLLEAGALYQFTLEFLNKTSLGANDAARRVSIVTALQAAINSNTEIRSERYEYNLIMCPGFPELADEMVRLSQDVGGEAFVVADTPVTLSPEEVVDWGNTNNRVRDSAVSYYYPGGVMSNMDGKNVYVYPSVFALRVYTNSDNASYVHYAPAGPRRGGVNEAIMMGYLTGTLGTPTTIIETNLNVGQRGNLYGFNNNINPITDVPGYGVLVMGQKTSVSVASAMDRVAVCRMIASLRRSLRKAAFSFLFEPNDQITRDNLKSMVDGKLVTLMRERGLYDFVTLCDSSNNGPEAIDRGEMRLDVALKPVHAAEFIYIPIRVLSTGAAMQ